MEILNTNLEIRKKSEIRKTNDQNALIQNVLSIFYLDFPFVSDFCYGFRTQARKSPLSPRRAYTLLEVILALSLAVVILGLVGVGIHVHLAVAAKSRDQVEEAQLARVLLQRIADDLRNAVPFQPASSSSSSASDLADAVGASPLAAPSGTSDSSSTTPLSGGIYGAAQAMQIETARRPRATLVSLQTAANDPSQPARLSDIRVVSYSLGAPTTLDMSQQGPPSTSGTGLYRHEQDRAEFVYGSQNGQVDESDPTTELLAPEVVDLQLTYYGGTGGTASDGTTSGGTSNADTTTNGTTSDNQWDSTQQGMLPAAVKISISLRREAPKSLLNVLDNEKRPAVVYSLLVSLPNASVDAGSRTSQQAAVSTQAESTPPPQATPTTPTNGRGRGGQNGQAQGSGSGQQGPGGQRGGGAGKGNGKGGGGRGPGGQQGGSGTPGQGRFGGGGGRGGASQGGPPQGPPSSGGPPAAIPPGAGKGGP